MKTYGICPFWFWNDNLDKQELRRQVREMADKGVSGFFIHPRQGLKQPYLSEEFFNMVRTVVDEAEKNDMDVHINDEYPYPSGVAGGEVVLGRPEYQATTLVQLTYEVEKGPCRLELLPTLPGYILNCTAFQIVDGKPDWNTGTCMKKYIGNVLKDESYLEMGLTKYNRKRYFAGNPTPFLQTEFNHSTLISVSVQECVSGHKYWGKYVDVLNPDAIKEFIHLTHERYAERFQKKFGKTIISFFVDETAPKWSVLIPPAFKKEYRYDLIEKLPALHLEKHPEHLKVRNDFEQLKHKMFIKSFEEPISNWCNKHKIKYSGEKPSFRLSQLKYMGIPGCEPGHVKAGMPLDLLGNNLRQNARAAYSAAYFYDKPASLCECFHSIGWSGTLQDARIISDGLLQMGIQILVPHGFFYTTHSLKKHDAPPTFFYQAPYWHLFGKLSDRVDKISQTFTQTWIDAATLIIDPSPGLPSKKELGILDNLQQQLMKHQIDFLFADTDILASGRVTKNSLKIKDINVKTILIPPSRMMEKELEKQLELLERKGINIVHIDNQATDKKLQRLIQKHCETNLKIKVIQGSKDALWMVTRTDGSQKTWFLINTGNDSVELLFKEPELSEIPLDNTINPRRLKKTKRGYQRILLPYEAVMLNTMDFDGVGAETLEDCPACQVVASWRRLVLTPNQKTCNIIPLNIPDQLNFEILNNNFLRLGEWQLSLDNGKTSETVQAISLGSQLQKGNFAFVPKVTMTTEGKSILRLPELDLFYITEFKNQTTDNIELVMEPNSIVGDWSIRINGGKSLTSKDFALSESHVKGSLGVDISKLIVKGINRIEINVKTSRADGGLVNPLYLAGKFGVNCETCSLGVLPASGGFEKYKANALPYFSGTIEYSLEFNLDSLPETDVVFLDLDQGINFQESCEISVNDSEWGALCWSPYLTLVQKKYLCLGKNTIKIRVHTTLIRVFEGEYFDIKEHRNRPVIEEK